MEGKDAGFRGGSVMLSGLGSDKYTHWQKEVYKLVLRLLAKLFVVW